MDPGPVLRFGVFELDPREGDLRRAGRRVPLQQQPLKALLLLASRPGQVVTREELRAELWPEGTHVDFERGINFCLNQVRTALRDPARSSHFIETVPRVGYRFVGDVRVIGSRGPAADGGPTTARRRPLPWVAGTFTTQPLAVQDALGPATLAIAGRFTANGLEATVTVSVSPAASPSCRYLVGWTGAKQGPPNVLG